MLSGEGLLLTMDPRLLGVASMEHSHGMMASFKDSEGLIPLEQWRLEDLCFSQESVRVPPLEHPPTVDRVYSCVQWVPEP